jgi:predicted lipoprotein with Yx(FWY)xxD motif
MKVRRSGPSRTRCFRLLVPALGVVIAGGIVSGCASSGVAVSTPYATTPPVLQHGPKSEVKVENVAGLGPVLVDGQGITLYLFETDRQGSPSRCYDICAIQWPPLTLPKGAVGPIAGPGVSSKLLGTAPRTGGSTQITYNGWPLYLWPPDRRPGKATGQALTNAGGVWYVVDAAGNAVRTPT